MGGAENFRLTGSFDSRERATPMRLTTKGRFAVTAMIDLGLREHRRPVTLAGISQRQRISLSGNGIEGLCARLPRGDCADRLEVGRRRETGLAVIQTVRNRVRGLLHFRTERAPLVAVTSPQLVP